jgi:hypothetical protein
VTGASVACNVQQDRAKNDGSNALNRKASEASWWTTDTVIEGNTFEATIGHKIALMTYADGPAKGQLAGADMIASLKGNRTTGSVQLGSKDGNTRPAYSPTQLASLLGAKYSAQVPVTPADLLGWLNDA